ncbi:TA system toxin CbtA family protein [Klebsiella aerogenes]
MSVSTKRDFRGKNNPPYISIVDILRARRSTGLLKINVK